MTEIEKFLHQHFASLDEGDNDTAPHTALPVRTVLPDSQPEILDVPFAKVNTVAEGSPAESAGLKPGDAIRNFGYVNDSNHDNLRRVAECVQGNEGVCRKKAIYVLCILTTQQSNILIKVSRPTNPGQWEELRLTLTPRKDWGGRGMLGCHILPL